jgi:hypothetical protein
VTRITKNTVPSHAHRPQGSQLTYFTYAIKINKEPAH